MAIASRQSRRTGRRCWRSLGTLFVAILSPTLASCNERASAHSEAEGAVTAAVGAPAVPAAKHSAAEFTVELTGPARLKIGESTPFNVTLRAGKGFKVNQEYPHKFKSKATSGLVFAQTVVDKTAARLTKSEAVFPIVVTGGVAGKRTVAGQLAFSVCTDEKCLIERSELALEVNVQ